MRPLDPATIRHAPRLGRFVLAGIVLGALVALVLTFVPGVSALATSDLFWLLFLGTGLAGAVLGLVAFWWADRRSLRAADAAARRAGRSEPRGAARAASSE